MKKKGIKKNRVKSIMKIFNSENTSELNKLDDVIYSFIKTNQKIDYTDEIIKQYTKKKVNERYKNLKSYIQQLNILIQKPVLKQRTIEWLEARKNILTASDLEDALSKNCMKLAKKKAGVTIDNTVYSAIPALKWGTMFEEMATRCYSQKRNNLKIYEFGLIIDEKQDHFGASPDGINEHGVMIEIKCPYSRKIKDGNIPSKYYMQIQGQLATCCLEDCDYIECNFKVFINFDEYLNMVDNDVTINHGVIAEFKNSVTNEFSYIYSDPDLKPFESILNIQEKCKNNKDNDLEFIKYTPWNLLEMNIQRVSFDKEQWKETSEKIQSFWDFVEECKKLPIEHIKAKKKVEFINEDD